jgi:hypothetical protein
MSTTSPYYAADTAAYAYLVAAATAAIAAGATAAAAHAYYEATSLARKIADFHGGSGAAALRKEADAMYAAANAAYRASDPDAYRAAYDAIGFTPGAFVSPTDSALAIGHAAFAAAVEAARAE